MSVLPLSILKFSQRQRTDSGEGRGVGRRREGYSLKLLIVIAHLAEALERSSFRAFVLSPAPTGVSREVKSCAIPGFRGSDCDRPIRRRFACDAEVHRGEGEQRGCTHSRNR